MEETIPERGALIVILYHSSLLAFQIQDTSGIWLALFDIIDYTASMGFGGVFAAQNGFNVKRHCREVTTSIKNNPSSPESFVQYIKSWDGGFVVPVLCA